MFFELNNVTYHIKFRREGTTTYATLYRVEKDGILTKLYQEEGMASLFHKDRFEKAKGRKVALADLLWKFSIPDSEGEFPEGLSKEDRQTIWTEYFIQFNR